MTTYTFQGYRGRAEHRFTCANCQKPNRTRTFTCEHTVNPFNRNEDGTVKQASQVGREAREAAAAERDEFAQEPWCRSCEDTLSYAERKALRERRNSAMLKAREASNA